MNTKMTLETVTAGGALLMRLKALGVDYMFVNSGTDFPPIIEGLSEAEAKGNTLPQSVIAPHENVAMGMAHGHYILSGQPQVVAAHTNVGLANCAIGAINAATEQVPMVLMSGRTPVTEAGRFGCRTVPIGWGQEMFDQTALVREASKWDYEIRFPEQMVDVLDRAVAICASEPKGPVYLALPREVLCEACPSEALAEAPRMTPVRSAPDAESLKQAAQLIANAERPLVIAQRGPSDQAGFDAIASFTRDWALPVVQYWVISPSVSFDHPMACGEKLEGLIEEADVILTLDCLAPWDAEKHKLRPDVKVIHVGADPLYARTPIRNFRSDVSLRGETGTVIAALQSLLSDEFAAHKDRLDQRRRDVEAEARRRAEQQHKEDLTSTRDLPSKRLVSRRLAEVLDARLASRPSTVFSELGCQPSSFRPKGLKSWYQEPHSGGLGFSFPAALGAKLADRERFVVATMGDGSYMFANPVACHQVAEAHEIPILVLVLNNAEWGAVKASVTNTYPDGYAARSNNMPLVGLAPSPDFAKVAEASRAWSRKVTREEDLIDALNAAIDAIENEGRLALLDIQISD
jgi:acetolactate synthase I/II/III large subunit